MRQVKHAVVLFLLWMVCTGANAIVYSGVCGANGDNLKWSLDTQTGMLEIAGTGMMMDYDAPAAVPWRQYVSFVTDIIIGNAVTSIGKSAFNYCYRLTSITIPNSVTSIGVGAFSNCVGLTSVTIPISVSLIGDCAFQGCSGLTSISIPKSVSNMGKGLFQNCTNLTSITVSSKNPIYDSRNNCNAIIETATNKIVCGCKNTTIPNTVICIGDGAFNFCQGLTSIIIPNTVTSIENGAFWGCKELTSIYIPNSVSFIGHGAFGCCPKIISIIVDDNNINYDSREGCNAIIEKSSNILICGCKNTVIPHTVTGIGYEAFRGCTELTSITIPNSVKYIQSIAFEGCWNLTSINIPDSVIWIGNSAFFNCSSLASITIPNSVTDISNEAFGNCGKLSSIYLYRNQPLSIPSDVFRNADFSNIALFVPLGTKPIYESANVWKDFGRIVEFSIPVTSIMLDNTSVSISLRESITLKTMISPENATYQNVVWSSSNTDVATVSNGVVKGINVGTATITATTTDGTNLSASCVVTVNPILASSISLNKTSEVIFVGENLTLSATIKPDNTTNKTVEWSSSNNSVVTVSNGIVKAVAVGKCVIKAKTTDGSNLECDCNLTVVDVPVSVLSFDKESVELLVEDETTITASVFPSNATNPTLAWTSSNGNVAIVNNGKITAIGAGNAVISARTTDGTNKVATCNVKVNKHSQTIDWNQTLTSLVCGGELVELTATASSGLPITYKSSNDDVVSIFDMGNTVYLNPISSGTSKITATQTGTYYYEAVSTTKDVSVVESNSIWEVTPDKYRFAVYTVNGIHVGDFSKSELVIFMQQNELKGLYIVNGKKVIIK